MTDLHAASAQALLSPEVRAAFGVVTEAAIAADPARVIRGHVIGQPELVAQLARYCELRPDRESVLVTLSAEPAEVRAALSATTPEHVITLVAGNAADVLRRFRATPILLSADLPQREWAARGYRCVESHGVQGGASTVWAVAQRLADRLHRTDLADRCRIAMMQTLVTSALLSGFASASIREYRRSA
jgi:hypothetical protein